MLTIAGIMLAYVVRLGGQAEKTPPPNLPPSALLRVPREGVVVLDGWIKQFRIDNVDETFPAYQQSIATRAPQWQYASIAIGAWGRLKMKASTMEDPKTSASAREAAARVIARNAENARMMILYLALQVEQPGLRASDCADDMAKIEKAAAKYLSAKHSDVAQSR